MSVYTLSDYDAITFNGVNLDQVYFNNQLVWEAWKLKTGNLYAMTSNNWNGFVATGDGGDNPYYYLFDNNAETRCTNLNGNLPPHWWEIRFPKNIRIQEVRTCLNATLGPDGFGYKGIPFTE